MGSGKHLSVINQRINELLGLHFAENQYDNLVCNLQHAAKDLYIDHSLEYICKWISRPDISHHELEILTHHLTIGETYFFREKVALKLLAGKIIPDHIAGSDSKEKRQLRIWSAGCSSGEEPYSIAIMLKESVPDIDHWDLTLLATDVNTKALKKAKEGIYTPWSFRETPELIKKKYFNEKGRNFEIKPEIKKMVQFSPLNLATDDFPALSGRSAQMDVIFCRNVLMYFSQEAIHRITKKLYQCLNTDGWLITGQVELNDEYFSAFQRVLFDNGIFYRKTPVEQKQKQLINFLTPLPTAKPLKVKTSDTQASGKMIAPRKLAKQFFDDNQRLLIKTGTNGYQGADNPAILFASAKSLADKGKLDEAETIMKQLQELDSSGAEHFYVYATILAEKNRWEEVNRMLVKALYLEPKHLAARYSRIQALNNLEEYEQAAKEIQNLMHDIEQYDENEVLPTLDSITAGRLRQMTDLLTKGEKR